MRSRTKKQLMDEERTAELLMRAKIGHLATLNENGAPYVVPVQFAVMEGKLYFHSAMEGQKLQNILRDGRVCFEICEEMGLLYDPDSESACAVNTKYESAVIFGTGQLIERQEEKERALRCIVGKYAPELAGKPFRPQSFANTAVVAVEIGACTGKAFRGREEAEG